MSKDLFKDFPRIPEDRWKQKIKDDLKKGSYSDLQSTAPGGITVEPFYHRDSAPALHIPPRADDTWFISQLLRVKNATEDHKKLQDILSRGAEGGVLRFDKRIKDLDKLLEGLPEKAGIQVHPQFIDFDFLKAVKRSRPTAFVHIDPLHHLASTGDWWADRATDMGRLLDFVSDFEGYFANISVRTGLYTDAGADEVSELAYFLAQLNEYLNSFDRAGNISLLSRKRTPPKRINIDTSIGSNYFYQIAKYRSYRVLTRALGKEYGLELDAYITASPSPRNKSMLDYNINMLRTTTECMSAVLGGADTVYNLPYDDFFHRENEFAERIARNQLLILKEESYMDKVNNPADGAYYIDTLTRKFTQAALDKFREIEQDGGLITQLENGAIQQTIKAQADKEQQAVDDKKRPLLGVNKYPNETQKLPEKSEVFPFSQQPGKNTTIEPITPQRLAETQEEAELEKFND